MAPETSDGLVCDLLNSGSYSVHTLTHIQSQTISLILIMNMCCTGCVLRTHSGRGLVRSNVERIRLLVVTRARAHAPHLASFVPRFVNPSVSSQMCGMRVENAPIHYHPAHPDKRTPTVQQCVRD